MKQIIKINIDEEDVKRLRSKAEQSGFYGRGNLNRYFEKISRQPICFLDENVKAMLSVLNLQQA